MTTTLYILKKNIEVPMDFDVLPCKDDIILLNGHRYIVVERVFDPVNKKYTLTIGAV